MGCVFEYDQEALEVWPSWFSECYGIPGLHALKSSNVFSGEKKDEMDKCALNWIKLDQRGRLGRYIQNIFGAGELEDMFWKGVEVGDKWALDQLSHVNPYV